MIPDELRPIDDALATLRALALVCRLAGKRDKADAYVVAARLVQDSVDEIRLAR